MKLQYLKLDEIDRTYLPVRSTLKLSNKVVSAFAELLFLGTV